MTNSLNVTESGLIVNELGVPVNQYRSSKGYLNVRDGGKMVQAHRLIALALVPNPENKPQVNHKDGDKTNNHPSNLEWVTCRENIMHSRRNGLNRNHGIRHMWAKLTECEVDKVRAMRALGKTYTEIAKLFGVSKNCTRSICIGRTRQRT